MVGIGCEAAVGPARASRRLLGHRARAPIPKPVGPDPRSAPQSGPAPIRVEQLIY